MITPALLPTDDGSHTLRHPVLGDTYHSSRGAVGEAKHVFIEAGFNQIMKNQVRIFEMGFGSGLNAFLTWIRAKETGQTIDYQTIELYPIDQETALQLNYAKLNGDPEAVFRRLHSAPWGENVRIDTEFQFKKEIKSLTECELDGLFDLIYFDAFAPDTQPELWTEAVFEILYRHTAPGGILTTYSAKGAVKRALQTAGYAVEKLPGALGKRHMLRGIRKF